jgi:hypothetical protein
VTRNWSEHAQEAPGIIEYLYELKRQATCNIASRIAPAAKSRTGLFESDFDLFAREHSGLRKLKLFIIDSIQQSVSNLNGKQVPPAEISVTIDDAWYHITNDGGFHDAHGHQQCSWCGIYYLQIGQSGKLENMAGDTTKAAPNGGNRFYSPFQLGGRYLDYGNQYLDYAYLDPPIENGLLLLFPSHLQHSALPYRGEHDRVVIAFNSRCNAPGSQTKIK